MCHLGGMCLCVCVLAASWCVQNGLVSLSSHGTWGEEVSFFSVTVIFVAIGVLCV